MNDYKNVICDVAGKCCESGDIVASDYPLGKIEKNDKLSKTKLIKSDTQRVKKQVLAWLHVNFLQLTNMM